MFNSTHTLLGLAIARTGADERVRYAAVTAVIASNLPDVDILTVIAGTPAYLEYHRGITHSLIGIPALALLLAGAVYFFSGNFWKTLALIFVTMATHPLLDFANNYGWRPFTPLSGTWHYGDILFIFDPYIDAILLAGIIGGVTFTNTKKALAWMSIVLVIAYIGFRFELHEMACSRIEDFAARIPGSEKWAVFPRMLNPFMWDGIVQTKDQLVRVPVHSTKGAGNEAARVERGPSTEIVKRAARTNSADVLLRFARFPAVRVEKLPSGYRVTFFDFRFANASGTTALGAEVTMDAAMHVTKENLSFVETIQ